MDYRETLDNLAERSRKGDHKASAVLQRELEAPLNRLSMREARLQAERFRRLNERRRLGQSGSDNSSARFDESDWLMKRLIGELCRKATQPREERLPDPHRETIRI
jgi:hypothetical protein